MTRLNSASSWVMVIDMNNWATGYRIQFLHLKFMMITDEPTQSSPCTEAGKAAFYPILSRILVEQD